MLMTLFASLHAAELGLHGVLDQAQSRGDTKATANPDLGLYSTRYSHKPSST